MPIVTLILAIALVGLLLWLVETFIPMDAKIKLLLQVVVVVALVLWLLQGFGFLATDLRLR